ncbi:hypothetical protein LEM8419_00693 [Neolewinella maritima]|uniref:Glycoside hydrolase n=1 Tax=Neolewinella maritima TaxID=1383882 RepID=A0ABM9AXY2_9BACT|nr:glycosyl hydrolase [Neolewinella maritima]CAH0999395.1 hypothetical protein LEM8419_00693 [Neolewinella maritima]
MKYTIVIALLCMLTCVRQPDGKVATSAVTVPPRPLTELERKFINPPAAARPRTWYHVMSGNMSKAGITKDLESMAEVGIGGLLLFNVTQGIPLGTVTYDSPEHHDILTHAAAEAERLGLTFGVHNCDGWSSSGGPWVTPEQSMKMVVYRDTVVGGGQVELQLPQPTIREGFYRDIATIAYPALRTEYRDRYNQATVTASDPAVDLATVANGRIDAEITLPGAKRDSSWVQFSYPIAKSVRSARAVFADRHITATLYTSRDGWTFVPVRPLMKVRTGKGEWAVNDHFAAVSSRFFRIVFDGEVTIRDAELTSNYYYQNPLGRLAIARTEDADLGPIGTPRPDQVIDPATILVLTDQVVDGTLTTTLPPGDWTVMRFGYTSTGAFNNPASEEGRGLEVDKLSRPAFKLHYDNFVKQVIDEARPVAPIAMQYLEIDSYEMGGQNWTEGFAEGFRERYGYELIDYLPLLAGRFVGSAATTEAVLEDYRRQISDLMTENYFGYFAELCAADGMQAYIEPYGFGPLNDLAVGGKADIPMGEFWMNRPITQVRSAVSAAHIYGKPVISAESFTSTPQINWKGNPAMAKTSGDAGWAQGINEFMFHRFVHQSNTHVTPGLTMNRWGFHFDRTQTWWTNAGADWFRYIARGSYLLRQGVPVADLLVFVGDGAPNSTFDRDDFTPAIPRSINYDCINAEVLIDRIKIVGNELVLPEGTTYRMLALQNSDRLTLPTLRRLAAIARAGVPVYGSAPTRLIGYGHDTLARQEFAELAEALGDLLQPYNWAQATPDATFAGRDDIDYVHRRTEVGEDIYFFYNADSTATTYDVTFRNTGKLPERWNPLDGSRQEVGRYRRSESITEVRLPLQAGESVFVVFRRSDSLAVSVLPGTRVPADEALRYYRGYDGKLYVNIEQSGTYSHELSDSSRVTSTVEVPAALPVDGPWRVTFDAAGGYGGTLQFPQLTDWKNHAIDSIRYFSGTAIYTMQIDVPRDRLDPDLRVILDLGEVRNVAEVSINGKSLGVSWMPPFERDVTDYLTAGTNTLSVAVTNLWANRLIGEERYPDDAWPGLDGYRPTTSMPAWFTNNAPRPAGPRTTFTTGQFYDADDPLEPSGLLGPVRLRFQWVLPLTTDR